jgi:hypothetical protein
LPFISRSFTLAPDLREIVKEIKSGGNSKNERERDVEGERKRKECYSPGVSKEKTLVNNHLSVGFTQIELIFPSRATCIENGMILRLAVTGLEANLQTLHFFDGSLHTPYESLSTKLTKNITI